MFFKVLIFLYTVVPLSFGGESDICDKIEPNPMFDAKKIDGIWYGQECSAARDCEKIVITGAKGLVQVSTRTHGKYINENVSIIQVENTSKFSINIGYKTSPTDCWVTDYDNFLVRYSSFTGKVLAELSTRTRNPGAEIIEKAKETMKKNGFKPDQMKAINQSGCTN